MAFKVKKTYHKDENGKNVSDPFYAIFGETPEGYQRVIADEFATRQAAQEYIDNNLNT